MSFPLPALDDRRFQDIVDEAKRRIPLHTPEWTDHNVSDPGVALIELFAWMTESITYRLNQVPDRLYRSFLDLIGFSPYQPRAATTPVTFWIGPKDDEERTVGLGVRVATTQDADGASVEFMTKSTVTIRQPELTAVVRGYSNPSSTLSEFPKLVPHGVPVIDDNIGGVQVEEHFYDPKRIDSRAVRQKYDVVAQSAAVQQSDEKALFEPADSTFACFTIDTGADADSGNGPDVALNQALYFGFDKSLAGNVLHLDVTPRAVNGTGVLPESPPLIWEVSVGPDTWCQAEVDLGGDTTKGLNVKGRVLLYLPFEHTEELHGERAFWLRVRLTDGAPAYAKSPTLATVQFRSLGGRAMAEHGSYSTREELGVSTGKADQSFRVLHRPVLPRKRVRLRDRGEKVEKVAADGTTRRSDEAPPDVETIESVFPNGRTKLWEEVDDFASSEATDRHFTWDSATGQIKLGPAVREANFNGHLTGVRQRGLVPEAGTRFYVTGYRTGGGVLGNVQPGSLVVDRSGLPWVQRVDNRTAAEGGLDAETIDNAKIRGPMALVTGDRAVTTTDYEHLTLSHHPEVERALCRAATTDGEPIRLRVVCRTDQTPGKVTQADFMPDNLLLLQLKEMLDERRLMGVNLDLGPAEFRGVSIASRVVAADKYSTYAVREHCIDALEQFVNPVTGGSKGDGWPWGMTLDRAMIAAVLNRVDGVHKVDDVLFFDAGFPKEKQYRQSVRSGIGASTFELPEFGLPVSGSHQVLVNPWSAERGSS